MNDQPRGVHQGAQCDRASLALNYYYNGMNFLYPEVHENRCKDGIVSCELPLSNYLTAILYKLLGFNEKWFRLLTFVFLSIGMFTLFLFFQLYVKSIVSYLLVLIINSSPIVLFYASNFIPDSSALGLILVSWFLFFKLFISHTYLPNLKNRFYLFIFILTLSLAIASKTTCIIQWLSMSAVFMFSYIKRFKIKLENKNKLGFALLVSLIIPVLWQLWARHLGTLHNSEFFMLSIPVLESLPANINAWQVYLSNWPQETFASPLYGIIGILLLFPFFIKRKIEPSLWFLSVINTIGSFLFMLIMIKQFMYHDYYILCLLPAIFINWAVIASFVIKLNSNKWWLKIGLFIGLFIAFLFQFSYGKRHLEMRYTVGNYWEQSQQNTTDYKKFRFKINKLGIDRQQCVLVGYDGAPNNMLYLLDLKGKRINKDFNDEQIKESVNQFKPGYLISNDSTFTNKLKPYFKELLPLVNEKYLTLYKIAF